MRGRQTRRAFRAVPHACDTLQSLPGDHLRIHRSELSMGSGSDFYLTVLPPPQRVDVWCRADEAAIDIHRLLHFELEAVFIQAARVQTGLNFSDTLCVGLLPGHSSLVSRGPAQRR